MVFLGLVLTSLKISFSPPTLLKIHIYHPVSKYNLVDKKLL